MILSFDWRTMPQTFAEEKSPPRLHKQRNGSSLTTCTHTYSPIAITSLHRIHYWFSIRLRFIHSFCAFGAQPIHVRRPVRQLTLLLNPSLAVLFARVFGILFLIEPLLLLMPFRICASNNVSIGSTSIPARCRMWILFNLCDHVNRRPPVTTAFSMLMVPSCVVVHFFFCLFYILSGTLVSKSWSIGHSMRRAQLFDLES